MITRLHVILLVFSLLAFGLLVQPPGFVATGETLAEETDEHADRQRLTQRDVIELLAQALAGLSDKVEDQSSFPSESVGVSETDAGAGADLDEGATPNETVDALVATLHRLAAIEENQRNQAGQGGGLWSLSKRWRRG